MLLTTTGLIVGALGFLQTEGSYVDGTNHVTTTGRAMNVGGLVALLFGGYLSFSALGGVHERS